jgi:glycosyltransferase involved in cell wall biosynthesis
MSTENNSILSIIITTMDPNFYLERLFESLLEFDLKQINIVVVNQYKDSIISCVDTKNIQFNELRPDNKMSASGARNFGAKHSLGKFLLFLDDDCVLLGKQKNLDLLIELLSSDCSNVILLKPALLSSDGSFKSKWSEKNIKLNYYNLPYHYVEWSTIIERKLFESIGGFHDNLSPGSKYAAQCGEITVLVYNALYKNFSISTFKDLTIGHGHVLKKDSELKLFSYKYGVGYSSGFIIQYLPLWHKPLVVCGYIFRQIYSIALYKVKFYFSKNINHKKELIFNKIILTSFIDGLLKDKPKDKSYIESYYSMIQ